MLLVSQRGDRIYNMDNIVSVYVKYNNTALSQDKRKYFVMAETSGKDDVTIAEYSSRQQAINEIYEISAQEARRESPYVMKENKVEG